MTECSEGAGQQVQPAAGGLVLRSLGGGCAGYQQVLGSPCEQCVSALVWMLVEKGGAAALVVDGLGGRPGMEV